MGKKSVKKNYIYNVLYQLLAILIPVITTPYLSRVLGAENIGIYSYTLSIVTYFILFGSLGVAMYGQREIAYVQEDIEKRSVIFIEIVLMRFITLLLSLVFFYIFFCLRGDYSFYYKILILELVANMLDISWFFSGMEEFKKTVTRNTFVKLISLISIFIFVKSSNDLYIYFLIYVSSTFLGNLSLWLYLRKYIIMVPFKKLNIFRHIKPTILLFIPQIAVQVYTLLDKTMLGVLTNNMEYVGFYEQSQKIIKTSLIIVTSLGTVVAPRIANMISKGEKEKVSNYLENSYHFVWLVGFPLMMGIIATAKNMVPWFLGEKFTPTIPLLMVGSLLIIAIGLNNVSGIQFLIPAKKQNLFTKSVVIAAITNFVLNYILIPFLGPLGAIIASIIAETLIIIIQAIDIRNDIDLKIIYKYSVRYIIGSIFMFVGVYILGLLLKPNAISTFIQLVVGILLYGFYLLIIKDNYTLSFINKILNKIRRKKYVS